MLKALGFQQHVQLMTTSDSSNSPPPSAELPSEARHTPQDATAARLSSAFAAGKIGAWSWELDTQQVFCDEFSSHLLSIDPDVAHHGFPLEIFLQTVLPESREAVLHILTEARASTDFHEADFRVHHTSGEVLWLRSRGQAVLDQGGKLVRRHGIFMDVTAHKHAEAQSRTTTELLEASQSIAGLGGWELDIESGQLFWTNETYRIHDTSPGEFNPTVAAGVSYFLPESRQLINTALDAAMTYGKGYDLELETLTTKGRLINVRTTCVVTMNQGQPVKLTGIFQDITEQKQVEKIYQESEDRFRMLIEGTTDVVTIADAEGRYTYVNNQAAQIMGYDVTDMVGRLAFDFVHPDDRARSMQWFTDSIAAGEAQDSFEVRFVHQDGSLRFFISSSTFHFDDKGLLTHINTISHDNTSQRQTQLELERLAAIVENSADAIVSWTEQGHITSWNTGAEKLFGYSVQEVVGTSIRHLVPSEVYSQALEIITRLEAGETVKDLETIRRSKNGRLVHVSATYSPIKNTDEKVIGTGAIFRDITDRQLAEAAAQESQARLKLAVQVANIGPWDWDLITGNVDFSIEWKAQLGFTEDEISNSFDEFESRVHPEDKPHVLAAASAVHKNPTVGYNVDFRLRHKDGSYRWMHTKALMILNSQDQPVRMIGAHVDLTEQKNAEQQAFRSQRLESLGTLASGVAHDLNNALTPILMSTEILRTKYPIETKIIDVLEASAQRGANMVRQLLTFQRGVSGPRTEVDIALLIIEIENLMQGTFPKTLHQQVTCAPELPTVLGDATELHQVFLNLCVNARDAMLEGGAITVSAEYQTFQTAPVGTVTPAAAGNYVVVEVSDTGTGIPSDILEHIFDPFFTTKDIHKGTGLGLATVMGIIRGHAGFIKVRSQPDEGSTFTVFLPAKNGIPVAPTIVPTVTTTQSMPQGHGEKILFVEDEADIREVMSELLVRLNYQVVTAIDGADGLSRALNSEEDIDAVITDLHMPNMDGLEMTRALRQRQADTPILVASGRMDDNVAAELLSLGVTHLLSKPFAEKKLAIALETLLRGEKI